MRHKLAFSASRILCGALLLALCTISAPLKARQSESGQERALADVALAVVTCSSHPCLGEDEQEFREEMRGKVLSDGVFDYSDVTVAYPESLGLLHGDVEWDFDPELDEVDLRITESEIEFSVLLAELEHALPGCLMEQEGGEEMVGPDDQGECEEGATSIWSCEARGYGSDDISVDAYYIQGLVVLEISL